MRDLVIVTTITIMRPELSDMPATDSAPVDPLQGLPTWPIPNSFSNSNPIFFVGCHGGAGVTTLHQLMHGSIDAGRYWLVPRTGTVDAVLVTRTHAQGLRAAQGAARQWAAGSLSPGVRLLGLAAVADAPGRLPKPLRQLLDLIAGGVPELWHLPWVEALRLGDPVPQEDLPLPYVQMLEALQQVADDVQAAG
jgi:hypothetical protein